MHGLSVPASLDYFRQQVKNWQAEWQGTIEDFVSQAMRGSDGAHDISHVKRVVENAIRLGVDEQADPEVLLPAAWLHDCVCVSKGSHLRGQASRMAAKAASEFLIGIGYPSQHLSAIEHAIIAHSFSAQVPPESIEAVVLQDADRIEALGAIGAARCFVTSGTLGGEMYHPTEPIAGERAWDDRRFAVDHFFVKLLRLPATMKTQAGKRLAATRAAWMVSFLRQLADEAGWPVEQLDEAIENLDQLNS